MPAAPPGIPRHSWPCRPEPSRNQQGGRSSVPSREPWGQIRAASSGPRRCALPLASVFENDEVRGARVDKPTTEPTGAPAVQVEPEMRRKRWKGGRQRSRLSVWLRRVLLFVVLLGLLPALLTLAYLPPAVHPLSTLMMKDIVTLKGYDRRWTPIDEIGDRLIHSVMMSEDGQFCSHDGVDLAEFKVLLEETLAGETTRGGSTITMQTVKNLYL